MRLIKGLGVASIVLLVAGNVSSQVIFPELVRMRDGTRLDTRVSLPVGQGPWPVIVVRTPYVMESADNIRFAQLVNSVGYAFVIQNVRGRYGSEGDYGLFVDDGWGTVQDGHDTVEYVAQQIWCNGAIGTFGASADGITQELMAGATPSSLRCQVIVVGANDMYHQIAFQGGVFRRSLVEGVLGGIGELQLLPWLMAEPLDNEFWSQGDVLDRAPLINAPACTGPSVNSKQAVMSANPLCTIV